MKKKTTKKKKSRKSTKNKSVVQPTPSWQEIEINRLKGEIQAVKHYYAVLIAKNVAKVEDVVKYMQYKWDIEEEDKAMTKRLQLLEVRRRKAKKKNIKILLDEQIQSVSAHLQYMRSVALQYKSFHNKLVQVV